MTVLWIAMGCAAVIALMLAIASWMYREIVPPEDVPDDISALLPTSMLDTTTLSADEVDAAWRDSLPGLFEPNTPVDDPLLTDDTPPRFRRRPMPPPHLDHGTPRYPKDPKDHD